MTMRAQPTSSPIPDSGTRYRELTRDGAVHLELDEPPAPDPDWNAARRTPKNGAWDVTLDAQHAVFEDVDRRKATVNVKYEIPLAMLDFRPMTAKEFVASVKTATLAVGQPLGHPVQLRLEGNSLKVELNGVDGRFVLGMSPRIVLQQAGTACMLTLRSPRVTLRELDPEIRAGWGSRGAASFRQTRLDNDRYEKSDLEGIDKAIEQARRGPDEEVKYAPLARDFFERQAASEIRQLTLQKAEVQASYRRANAALEQAEKDELDRQRREERLDAAGKNQLATNQR